LLFSGINSSFGIIEFLDLDYTRGIERNSGR